MKRAYAVGAGLLTIALAAYAFDVPHPARDMTTTGTIAPAVGDESSFRLISTLDDGGCAVAAGRAEGDEKRALRLSPGCVDVNPALEGARWWVERPDGTVAFSTEDGGVVAEFAVADGAAFESYSPPQPIMVLLAAE